MYTPVKETEMQFEPLRLAERKYPCSVTKKDSVERQVSLSQFQSECSVEREPKTLDACSPKDNPSNDNITHSVDTKRKPYLPRTRKFVRLTLEQVASYAGSFEKKLVERYDSIRDFARFDECNAFIKEYKETVLNTPTKQAAVCFAYAALHWKYSKDRELAFMLFVGIVGSLSK